jgi:amidophosphoribosyltransferase
VDNVICIFLRGQESAGIVTSEGNNAKAFRVHKGMGMISSVFSDDSMKKLRGKLKYE